MPGTEKKPTYDEAFWEQLWSKTLREQGDKVAQRPPNASLVSIASSLTPGRALDAGCGHGAETLWLAAHGWSVTAVDFSASALTKGRALADAIGADVAARIDWQQGDLATWPVPRGHFDLVLCIFVHIAGSVPDFVRRMAEAVAPNGTLLLVGYRPNDNAPTGSPVPSQTQVSLEEARSALEPKSWQIVMSEERPRTHGPAGVDAIIVARRQLT